MFDHLSTIGKEYNYLLFARMMLIIAAFAALNLLTLILGILLFFEWHVHLANVLIICIVPWMVAVVLLKMNVERHKMLIQQNCNHLFDGICNNLFFKVFSYGVVLFGGKKR